MSLCYEVDDFDLDGFHKVTSSFGKNRYGYVVTPNVDHLIRYHDDLQFRENYADAAYVLLDSRFLSYLFRALRSARIRVCTGSDLTAQLFAKVIATSDLKSAASRGLALCIGASINFMTGGERRAPKWVQHLGMEWLYRLMRDPHRLAWRYLVRGPRVFLLLSKIELAKARSADP
jgi:UDP-N-acetyl-D-mannosaminuronic acid transferase (WecB/TagA/CpsF family)